MSQFTNEVVGPVTDAEIRATPLPVSGTVSVGNFPATQPVSGTVTVANPGLTDTQLRATAVPVSGPLTDAQLRATPVPVSGTVSTSNVTSNSATIAQVTATTTNSTLLAANANRKKVIVFVASAIVYLKFGATASATSFTYKITGNNTILEIPVWTGQIDVITSAGTSVITVTELV